MHFHVQAPGDADGLREDLRSTRRLALDCEAAGFHRYSDRLCLLQVSTEHQTYIIDPLGFDPSDILRDALERPDVGVIMHGADFDLRLLRRDLGIRLGGLFDTQIAAALLGEEALGNASALLEGTLNLIVTWNDEDFGFYSSKPERFHIGYISKAWDSYKKSVQKNPALRLAAYQISDEFTKRIGPLLGDTDRSPWLPKPSEDTNKLSGVVQDILDQDLENLL